MLLSKIYQIKKTLLGLFVLALLLSMPCAVIRAANVKPDNAKSEYTLLEPLPCIPSPVVKDEKGIDIPGTEVKCAGVQREKINFQNYVQYAFNLLIALAAVAAVLMIVYGGFQYMTSDAYSTKSEGLKRVENAVYGLLLVLSSYLILKTIDPRLVKIPSTLVAPLKINYDKSLNDNLFNALTAQATDLRQQNATILDHILAQKAALDAKIKEKEVLQTKILSLTGAAPNTPLSEAGNICVDGTAGPSGNAELDAACIDLARTNKEVIDIKTASQLEVTNGIMQTQISRCLSAGAVSLAEANKCSQQSLDEIAKQYGDAKAQLTAWGQADKVRQIADYSAYARTMVGINNQLATLSARPYYNALVNTVQQANLAAGTALGYTLAGKTGAVAAFAIEAYTNSFMNAQISQGDRDAAQVSVTNIKNQLSAAVASTQDPDIKLMLQKQGGAIIKNLGGKYP